MGMISNAVARTMMFVKGEAPSYTTPSARPADNSGQTNADTSVSFIRRFVGIGPARTAPTTGSGQPTRPSPDGRIASALAKRKSGPYPTCDETTTNFRADGTDTRAPMKYGYQPLSTADEPNLVRPGASTRGIPDPEKIIKARKLS